VLSELLYFLISKVVILSELLSYRTELLYFLSLRTVLPELLYFLSFRVTLLRYCTFLFVAPALYFLSYYIFWLTASVNVLSELLNYSTELQCGLKNCSYSLICCTVLVSSPLVTELLYLTNYWIELLSDGSVCVNVSYCTALCHLVTVLSYWNWTELQYCMLCFCSGISSSTATYSHTHSIA
jgi:hypothetical protein